MEINWISIIIGAIASGYGIYTYFARRKSPEKFGKLAIMKKQWGEKKGEMIHVVAYTVVPIVFGIFCILYGLIGKNIFQ